MKFSVSVRAFVVAALCYSSALVQARTWEDGLAGNVGEMVFRYYLPANYDPSIEYPLVLFLHGSGESGRNNVTQVRAHIGNLIDKTEAEYPAILVAPQLPRSTGWNPGNPIDRTDEILDMVTSDYSVDPNRLYVTGLSMGGFGSMTYLHAYNVGAPDLLQFAAAAPLSGAFVDDSTTVLDVLRGVPIWMAHGDQDSSVNVETSRDTFRALASLPPGADIPFSEQSLGGMTAALANVRYTEQPNQGHVIWAPIYGDNALYDWMFSQSLVTIPEPTTGVLLACGLVCVGLRRRGRGPAL